MVTNYIGLSCTFHDAAIAVVGSGGEILFAEATERHLQSKRAINCPPDNLPYIRDILDRYCEPNADILAARSWSDQALRNVRLGKKLRAFNSLFIKEGTQWDAVNKFSRSILASMESSLSLASEGLRHQIFYMSRFYNSLRKLEVRGFDHHLTHAAAGCFTSPFDEAICAVIDGYGEGSSTAFFHYKDGKLRRLKARQKSVNSLGFYYLALCSTCGFDPVLGEEWKVMGLAPYGKFDEAVYAQLRPSLQVDGLRIVAARKQYGNAIWRANPPCSPEDLAFTGQKVFEECMMELLNNLYGLGISNNLVLAGGCALNSTCNGKILAKTGFRRLHIFAAPADDGNAMGAALLAYYQDNPDRGPIGRIQSPYLGESISADALGRFLRSYPAELISRHKGTIHKAAARELAEGRILGWVQGKAEFGPRALGNRSILADPRRAAVKDRINNTIKNREPFRPFAPSILHEHGPKFFEDYQEAPYMERTLRFRDETAHLVPGVVHVNGTGRLQTVKRKWNKKFYRLIEMFYDLTSIPILLNTSFNVMGRPIVHSIEDVLAAFLTTEMDILVIGDYMFKKRRV